MHAGKSRLAYVAVFAVAMAWMEAAVVYYLRVMVDRLQPYQPDPLPHFGGLGQAELIREGATLLMLLAVGWLAGERTPTRFAFSAFAFGVWDIFYYVFLIPLTGWPNSLMDWDLLFLIPVPWWGPVIAPVGVSLLLVTGGVLAVLLDRKEKSFCLRDGMWFVASAGTALVLYSFMANAIRAAGGGLALSWHQLPVDFPWGVFVLGFLLMAAPVVDMAGWILAGKRLRTEAG
jgi:hypothetical protein